MRVERERESSYSSAMVRARSSLIMNQCESTQARIRAARSAVSLALSFSICLKRNGRSEVSPVTEVMACSTSAAMMVLRFWLRALVSAALTTAADKVLSLVRKSVTASLPMRRVELAFMKLSTVFAFVISGFVMFGNIAYFDELCHFVIADSSYYGRIRSGK